MKKFLKITGITLVGLFVLLLVLPFIFKGKIISLAKEEAGKAVEATVDFSDISLSLIRNFPNFSLTVDKFSLTGKNKFEGDTLVRVEKLNLVLDVMSVINGDQYEIKKILIEKPYINLKVLADSSANWDIAKGETETEPQESDTASAFRIAMKDFTISKAHIVYDDKPNSTFADINGMDFNMKGDLTAESTALELAAAIESAIVEYGGVRYLNKAVIDFKAGINADLKNNLYTFADNKLTINDLGLEFSGWMKMLTDGYDMDLTFKTPNTNFKSVLSMIPAVYAKQFSDVKTSGEFSLNGFAKGQYKEENLPAFGLNLKVGNAMFQYPSLPAAVSNIGISASVTNAGGSADNTVVDVEKFHIELAGNPVDLSLRLKTPVSDPDLTLTAKGRLDLASVEKVYPIEQKLSGLITADLAISGRMSAVEQKKYDNFKADGTLKIANMETPVEQVKQQLKINSLVFNFSPAFLELTEFGATLGNTDLHANGKITQYLDYVLKDGTLAGNLNLTSNFINLDELMPETGNETTSDTAMVSADAVQLPERVDFVTNCSVAKLKYDKMELTNIKGEVVLRDRKLSLSSLTMNAFGGSLQTSGHIATPVGKPVEMNINAEMKQIDLQQLAGSFATIDSIAPVLKKVTGTTGISMKFNTLLNNDLTPDLNSIQSTGTLTTSQLTAGNIDVMNKAADLLKMDNLRTIKVSPTNLSYIIENGKLLVKPFDIRIDQINGTLGGSTQLSTQTLDYVLGLQIPRTMFGSAANAVVDGLVAQINKKGIAYEPGKNVAVDLLIGGTAKKPTVNMKLGKSESGNGVAGDLKAKAEEEFNKKKQELEAQAKAEIEKQKAEAEAKLKQEQEKLKQEADKKKKELEAKAKREADSLKKKLQEEAKKKLKKLF